MALDRTYPEDKCQHNELNAEVEDTGYKDEREAWRNMEKC